jgi:serine/threonine protein kinase/formylglycine-generating enzyme required for sulfatase activity
MAASMAELRAIFCDALECATPAERASFLDQACQGNVELRAEVETLLAAHAEAGELPPSSAEATTAFGPGPERPGTCVGPYKLLQFLGEGGMGTVFLAEQTEPVRRKVALKIIKPGLDSSQVLARFEAERQALALMDHPNIAKVFDAGTTTPGEGRPYFVMELVKGVPITEFCNTNKLTTRQRLELFIPVCLAIQHAHMKGIIHRDVKPSNVLIALYDGKPVPKVIDFGVAKAMAEPLTRRTLFTQLGQIVGTFEYMSPEQATLNQLDVDTRSDIYSLGVLLYELLTGSTPLGTDRLRSLALDQLLRAIREEEPLRPSARLSSSPAAQAMAAAYRGGDSRDLAGQLRGELDWIVMKCLEKERDRRFLTAGSLAQDIEHHLRDEPVSACPPSLGYRWRKSYRKHRAAITVAAGFVLLLVGGIIATSWQAIRATEAEQQAVTALEETQKAEERLAQQRKANEASERALKEQAELKRQATHAAGLVQSLLKAETAQVPAIIGELADYRKWADSLLREENDKPAAFPRHKLHVSLALLPVDAGQAAYLYDRLLDAEPREVLVIRDALLPHKDALLDKLWAVVEKPERGKESQRLQAAAALAKYAPESKKWTKANTLVVNDLVLENLVFLGQWLEAFRPVKRRLLAPLSDIYRDPLPERSAERMLATSFLADYADQPEVLADLLMDADVKQFAVLYPRFKQQAEPGLPELRAEIDRKPPLDADDDAREKLAKRQANAAVALLRMNQPEKAWPVLKHGPDPRARSYLIDRLYPLGADAGAIVKRLHEEPDITIRRALILSLGAYSAKDFSPAERKAVMAKVQKTYGAEADAGLHAAAEWLLRSWGEDDWLRKVNEEWTKDGQGRDKQIDGIKELVTKEKEKAAPSWYVNCQGQTMVVIPGPAEFMMGAGPMERYRRGPEPQHKKRIGRTFAFAATAVTKEQFLRFLPNFTQYEIKYCPEPTCPIEAVTWYEAAAYCNWLSQQEGIEPEQWCYETNAKGQVTKLREKYLSLTGYRLPSEAEREYATRAGALTCRCFGETEELLPKYAWYSKNSKEQTWPVGSLKPNDFGLFDLHGNVWEWCQDSSQNYPIGTRDKAVDDIEDTLVIVPTKPRIMRGGSFPYQASDVRSANRFDAVPTRRLGNVGFRVARTFTP